MLNFESVLSVYPERLRSFKENILKEYLQYKILDIIYHSKSAGKLVFIGGTAIRIVHEGVRFSEDLDFDNRGLTEDEFADVADLIKKELTKDGYIVNIKNVFRGAFHCHIRFPGILFEQGLSEHKEQRILIQVDAEPQRYCFEPEKFLINRFGLFRYIVTVPAPLLLAQKIFACLNRQREKGRDFFDVVFLAAKTEPDYEYLNQKIGLHNKQEVVEALRTRASKVNLKQLASDVEPFLFDQTQKARVAMFAEWVRSWGG